MSQARYVLSVFMEQCTKNDGQVLETPPCSHATKPNQVMTSIEALFLNFKFSMFYLCFRFDSKHSIILISHSGRCLWHSEKSDKEYQKLHGAEEGKCHALMLAKMQIATGFD